MDAVTPLCECGCGLPTSTYKVARGSKKRRHTRFIPGHQRRTRADWRPLFWKRVRKLKNGCWQWLGSSQRDGYGHFTVERVTERWTKTAHKVAYELLVGPVPNGLVLDHVKCHNKWCVNPSHLEPVTQLVNLLRSPQTVNSINKAKTHCKHGHEFTPENTYLRPDNGNRMCKACNRLSNKRCIAPRS